MTSRYETMFRSLAAKQEGAFIPFAVLGDPCCEASVEILCTMIRAGADALELGIPFSDPTADGPVIQRADQRAIAAGATPQKAWDIIGKVRQAFPDTPIGLLVYGNLVESNGLDAFYAAAKIAGVDSVLVADVPTVEAEPFCACARKHGIAPVMIASGNCNDEHLDDLARQCDGYTYVVTRAGVTGEDTKASIDHRTLLAALAERKAPPPVLGFGISRPQDVRDAISAGATGVISGSAVVRRIEDGQGDVAAIAGALRSFVSEMKAATRRHNA